MHGMRKGGKTVPGAWILRLKLGPEFTVNMLGIVVYHRVAGKRPAPARSDRLHSICRGWAPAKATRGEKPHLNSFRCARGVCKNPPMQSLAKLGETVHMEPVVPTRRNVSSQLPSHSDADAPNSPSPKTRLWQSGALRLGSRQSPPLLCYSSKSFYFHL